MDTYQTQLSHEHKDKIIQAALETGFDLVSFSTPQISDQDKNNFDEFLKNKNHGDMDWLATSRDLRFDPNLVFEGVGSIVVLGSYYRDINSESALSNAKFKVSRFAHGKDYHKMLRKKGTRLLSKIQQILPDAKGRMVTDSAPVLEKVLARQSGLGWRGKHTNIIHPDWGSYFFISALLLNLNVEPDKPILDLCRDCTLCVDACPTNALEEYKIDARKCLSFITIESKTDDYKNSYPKNRESWIFGCDICQEVCPYNRNRRTRGKSTSEERFFIRPEIESLMREGVPTQSDVDTELKFWDGLLQGSAIKRAGKNRILENMNIVEDD